MERSGVADQGKEFATEHGTVCMNDPDVLLLASGSEVALCTTAYEQP